jgi:glyoxylase-like metal-dependent hydrolase (beta-lactamase superfamily II)
MWSCNTGWTGHRRHIRAGAFAGLKQRSTRGNRPILFAIDTHWHFDHADNEN